MPQREARGASFSRSGTAYSLDARSRRFMKYPWIGSVGTDRAHLGVAQPVPQFVVPDKESRDMNLITMLLVSDVNSQMLGGARLARADSDGDDHPPVGGRKSSLGVLAG